MSLSRAVPFLAILLLLLLFVGLVTSIVVKAAQEDYCERHEGHMDYNKDGIVTISDVIALKSNDCEVSLTNLFTP